MHWDGVGRLDERDEMYIGLRVYGPVPILIKETGERNGNQIISFTILYSFVW